MFHIPALIGDYPTAYFVYETITWFLILGIPFLILFGWKRNVFIKKIYIFLAITGALIWGTVLYGSFIEPQRLVVREFHITDNKLPSLRLAVIADIHVGPYKDAKWVKKVVERLNKIEDVDALLIPGDFVFGGAGKYVSELNSLKDIKFTYKFATLGNHDHDIIEPRNTIQSSTVSVKLKELGLQELKNKSFFWEEKDIWIIGVDDNDLGYHDVKKAFTGVDDKPKIFLAHSPDILDEIEERYKTNLVISGHTHCGQIRLPSLGALPFTIPTKNGKKLERYLYKKNGQKIMITCGLGETGPRARLFNPPELVILNIN